MRTLARARMSRALQLLLVLSPLSWGMLKKSASMKSYSSADAETARHAENVSGIGGAGLDVEAEQLLLRAVDAFLHGVGADQAAKRSKLWSIRSTGPLASGEDGSECAAAAMADETLLHHQRTNGLRKTSVTARMLAEKADGKDAEAARSAWLRSEHASAQAPDRSPSAASEAAGDGGEGGGAASRERRQTSLAGASALALEALLRALAPESPPQDQGGRTEGGMRTLGSRLAQPPPPRLPARPSPLDPAEPPRFRDEAVAREEAVSGAAPEAVPEAPLRPAALRLVAGLVRALEVALVLAVLLAGAAYALLQAVRRLSLPLPPPLESLVELLHRRSQQALWRALGFSDKDSLARFLGSDPSVEDSRVGALLISGEVLGLGSHGTVVYKGSLNGRPVAIKRMLAQFTKAADREISLLIRSDGHANVVRYFLSERKGEFIYLALQLCHMSLKDFVVRLQRSALSSHSDGGRDRVRQVPDEARNALLEIALGVDHLHSNRIVHRDIKPHNILLERRAQGAAEEEDCALEHLGRYTLKLSDMGLSKQLDRDGSSFASMSLAGQASQRQSDASHQPLNPVGTIGWQAPELMAARNANASLLSPDREEESREGSGEGPSPEEDDELVSPAHCSHRRTQRVDIFSLGCVFYTVLVPGEHPFGQWFEREANIMGDRAQLGLLDVCEARDLIARMLERRPERRPSSKQVCKHPFFWSAAKRLDFLVEFSDALEHEQADAAIVIAVESNASAILGRGWDRRLDAALLEDMGKYRKYDTSSVRDCLRVIRNKRNHFSELSDALREAMAPVPSGFLFYFVSRFPQLFMHCVGVACRFLSGEKKFADYCASIASLYNGHPSRPRSDDAMEASPEPRLELLVDVDEEQCDLTSRESEAASYEGLVVWRGGAIAESFESNRGWLRDAEWWAGARPPVRSKGRPAHLVRSSTDLRYRSRLCTHWELNRGAANGCPMRKKGKCDFAHGPLELRVKDTRRGRWSTLAGGEDVLGAARSIEKVRFKEGSVSEFERSAVGAAFPKKTFSPHYALYSP